MNITLLSSPQGKKLNKTLNKSVESVTARFVMVSRVSDGGQCKSLQSRFTLHECLV